MKKISLIGTMMGLGLTLSAVGCGGASPEEIAVRAGSTHRDRGEVLPSRPETTSPAGDDVITPRSETPPALPGEGAVATDGSDPRYLPPPSIAPEGGEGATTGTAAGTPEEAGTAGSGTGGVVQVPSDVIENLRDHVVIGTPPATSNNISGIFFNAGVAVDYALRATGTLSVVSRDEAGRLHLCQGSSKPEKWMDDVLNEGSYRHRCIQLPTEGTVKEQPNLLFEPGAGGGKIHVFARSRTNESLAHTVCPAVAPDASNCRAELLPVKMKDSPSSVILADGTIYVFFQNDADGKITFVRKGPEQPVFDTPRRVNDDLTDTSQNDWDFCGPIWATPNAFVQVDDNGHEILHVTARDNDSLYGHVRLATLANPTESSASARKWDCRTFNNRRGQDDTGPMSLGSSPAAFFNAWTGKIQFLGKEHFGDHFVWWNTRTRADGKLGLEPSQSFNNAGGTGMDFPWTQTPSLVVSKNGLAGGSIHAVYRTTAGRFGERSLIHVYSKDPSAGTMEREFLSLADAAFGTPAMAMDNAGNLHIFAARQDSGRGFIPSMYHFFKAKGAESWTVDFVDLPVASGDASPAVLFTPNAFRL